MTSTISKNPFSLYRGSDISDKWYFDMKDETNELLQSIQLLEITVVELEDEKTKLIAFLESEFHKTKDTLILNIKRDVHNNRLNKLIKYPENCLTKLRLDKFIELLKREELINNKLLESYKKSYDNSRKILQREISDEELRKTIIFFNKNIYYNIDKYLDVNTNEHNKRLRKLDGFIINLLVRSSMKTSPFSFLTKTGTLSKNYTPDKLVNVEINHSLMYRILIEYLRNDEDAIKKVPVLVSRFGVKDSKILFITQENVKQSKKIFETRDRFIEFPLDVKLIDFLKKSENKVLYYEDFEKYLKDNSLYEDNEFDVYKSLVKYKILIQKIAVENKRYLIPEIIKFLKIYDICTKLSESLLDIEDNREKFETASVSDRLQIWSNIDNSVKSLCAELPSFDTDLLYEDVIFPIYKNDENNVKENIEFSKDFFEGLLDLILLFDVNIRYKFEVAHIFKNIYGSNEVNLYDSNLLNNVFFSPFRYFVPYFKNMNYRYKNGVSPEVKILDDIKEEFLDCFDNLIKNDESCIDIGSIIKKFSNKIPKYIKDNNEYSVTLFYQLMGEDIVLNDVYDGQEKFLSRFKDFFKNINLDPDYKEYIFKNYTNKNYYEVTDLFGFNGGIHERTYDKKFNLNIGYQRFIDESCDGIEDFKVKYDEKTKRVIFLDKKNIESKICYKSSLVPIFLPGILSVFLLMFQSGRLNFDINHFCRGKKHVNRIYLDNVIISREKWILNINEMQNIVQNSKTDMDLYLNIRKYFIEIGLPKKFFLKKFREEEEFLLIKPMFIDIEVPLIMKTFVSQISNYFEKDASFYIEEVLPEFQGNLTEYMVEYTIDK
ncbi:hypothetical protein GCM10008904_00200 [Paraclostridium ghonii]|uniref:Lanthionine biosynthesis protein n=1 Tax=Paraclostridium ghonii TaxID=29358 RepID=A0ABU0MYE7_9FIRM|nr:hypothetical protein [Paeniclostridium ghonii]MDQ0555875.1 hypothetical protein [Paeniclostridium ghonii]